MSDVEGNAVVPAKPRTPSRKDSHNLIFLELVLGVGLSFGLFWLARTMEQAREQRAFEAAAADRCEWLQRTLDRTVETVYSVKALLESDVAVNRQEFRAFTESLLAHHPEILSLEWLPRIPHNERATFVARLRTNEVPGFEIRDATAPGQYQPAAERAEYFPVLYVEPLEPNRAALGYDPSSEPARATAMQRARQSGKASATAAVTLLRRGRDAADSQVVMVFAPVNRPRALARTAPRTNDSFIGYSRAMVQVAQLLELASQDRLSADMDVMIAPDVAAGTDHPMYRFTVQSNRVRSPQGERREPAGWQWRGGVQFADRNWSVICQSIAGNRAWGWLAWSVLAGGLFSTLLGAGYVRTALRRRAERAVAEQALRKSQADLSHAQAVAHIGNWRSDLRSREIQWSDETYRIFGISPNTPMTHEAFLADVHPADREAVDRAWQAALKGAPYDIEHRILVGGVVKWVCEKAELEFDREGRLLGGFGTVQDITERKRAEAAQHASEERLSFALETIHTGAWDLDLVNHTAFRSIEHDRIFGYSELLSKWTYEMFLEHVLPEDRATVDGKFRRAIESQGDWNFECRIRRTDDEVRWIWAAGRHRQDAGGTRRHMAGIVQDITERKQAEAALAEREQRYRTLFDLSPSGILLEDTEGMILEVNEALCRQLGYSRSELVGKNVRMLVAPQQYPDVAANIAKILAGQTLDHVVENFAKDGRLHYAELRETAVPIAAGRRGILVTLNDITGRKRAEETARRERERLQRMVDSAQVGIAFASPDGAVHEVNESLLQLIGWTREEFTARGLNFLTLIAPEFREPDRDAMAQLARDGAVGPLERTLLHQDGRRIPVLCNRVMLPGGARPELAVIVQDLSEQRRLESALEDAAETERGRIARDLHDGLGQQLGGLLYLSRLLVADLQKREPAQTRQAEEIHRLVKEALEQNRNVAHGLHPVPAEPDGLMHALEMLSEWAPGARQVECAFECNPPVVVPDLRTAAHLYRIAQEAVNNARKHSGATRILIKLAARTGTLQLSVSDNGGGLPAGPNRMGLGMQTMKHRAALLGGYLQVQSPPAGGVEVICRVPEDPRRDGSETDGR